MIDVAIVARDRRIGGRAAEDVLVDELLEIDAGGAERADYDVGAHALVGRRVTPRATLRRARATMGWRGQA